LSSYCSLELCGGGDGLWLLAKIRDQYPTVATIIVSGDDSISSRFTLQPGVLGYLVKPVAPQLMLQAVNDAMTWQQVAARRATNAPQL
jgi:DNA-binding NarL/FixJ family response regulator